MARALKTISGFRKWINLVEVILYLTMLVVLLLTAYGYVFGG
jgi:uncharacterized membrane protein affecting hemolysin expression